MQALCDEKGAGSTVTYRIARGPLFCFVFVQIEYSHVRPVVGEIGVDLLRPGGV